MPFQPVVLLTIVFTLFCGGWLIVRWPAIPTTGRVTFSLALVLPGMDSDLAHSILDTFPDADLSIVEEVLFFDGWQPTPER